MAAVPLALLLAGAAPEASAQVVYKCRGSEGLTYQDKPCPSGSEELPAPHLAPPPANVPSIQPDPPRTAEQRRRNEDDDAGYQPPPPPPPTQYRCVDAVSGKSYVSAAPDPNPRYVPLWTVMPGGITSGGLSADLPTQDRPSAAALGSYTAVQNRCRPMPAAEQCGHWRQRLDEVDAKRRLAFNDTRPQLEQEEAGLNQQIATYCNR